MKFIQKQQSTKTNRPSFLAEADHHWFPTAWHTTLVSVVSLLSIPRAKR